MVAGNRGPVWPLEVPLRGAVAHRLRPVGISAQARSVTAGAGLALWVPGMLIGRPAPNQQPSCTYIRHGQARCARPFRTLSGREVFWRGQGFSDEPGLKAGNGPVLQDQLAAIARDSLGRSEIQR